MPCAAATAATVATAATTELLHDDEERVMDGKGDFFPGFGTHTQQQQRQSEHLHTRVGAAAHSKAFLSLLPPADD